MICSCAEFEEYVIKQIHSAIGIAYIHGARFDILPFRFCPYRGSSIEDTTPNTDGGKCSQDMTDKPEEQLPESLRSVDKALELGRKKLKE